MRFFCGIESITSHRFQKLPHGEVTSKILGFPICQVDVPVVYLKLKGSTVQIPATEMELGGETSWIFVQGPKSPERP